MTVLWFQEETTFATPRQFACLRAHGINLQDTDLLGQNYHTYIETFFIIIVCTALEVLSGLYLFGCMYILNTEIRVTVAILIIRALLFIMHASMKVFDSKQFMHAKTISFL